MKLVSLHIDNFGKFNNFDLDFNDGLNQFVKDNGWGKSTLTAFIKVMFYGFDNSAKRDFYENEKKRYKPWNGGVYGGNITFMADNKCYTIYRTFENKDKDDTFRLIDYRTRLKSDDYSSNAGYELFKIDSDTFQNTLCIYENNCTTESTGDIEALLGDEHSDTDDVNNFNKVIKNMDERQSLMSNAIYSEDEMQLILMIWGIPWERMTLGQANMLTVIGYLIQNAVVRANRYISALEQQRYIKGTNILEPEAFLALVKAYLNARDKGLTQCALLSVDTKENDRDEVGKRLIKLLRQSDYVGELEGGKMYALLANTSTKDATMVRERFEKEGVSCQIQEDVFV